MWFLFQYIMLDRQSRKREDGEIKKSCNREIRGIPKRGSQTKEGSETSPDKIFEIY